MERNIGALGECPMNGKWFFLRSKVLPYARDGFLMGDPLITQSASKPGALKGGLLELRTLGRAFKLLRVR